MIDKDPVSSARGAETIKHRVILRALPMAYLSLLTIYAAYLTHFKLNAMKTDVKLAIANEDCSRLRIKVENIGI